MAIPSKGLCVVEGLGAAVPVAGSDGISGVEEPNGGFGSAEQPMSTITDATDASPRRVLTAAG
jgi:hypothetical protein